MASHIHVGALSRFNYLKANSRLVKELPFWLADMLARIAAYPMKQLAELLPWNWKAAASAPAQAA